MNNDILKNHHIDLRTHLKTLHDLSQAEDKKHETIYALEKESVSGKIVAVDFDEIKLQWFHKYSQSPQQSDLNHQSTSPKVSESKKPCSVDAIYYSQDNSYMIEFKTGVPNNLLRKVYDTALLLIEHDNVTVQQLRETYSYIIVSIELSKRTRVLGRSYEFSDRPWENEDYQKAIKNDLKQWQLANIGGVVISKVYAMPPDMFERFVKFKKWQ